MSKQTELCPYVVGIRTRVITPQSNVDQQVGRPDREDAVIGFMFQNQGRNSLWKIGTGGEYVYLRPWEPPFEAGVQPPFRIEQTFQCLYENENQQQYDSTGAQPALDTSETDITEPDAVFHKLLLVEICLK